MTSPRVYYAMARDGLFPSPLASLHPRFGTPARATAVQIVVASFLVATGTFGQILSYFMAATLSFLALMVTVVYVLPTDDEAGRVPGYPFTPMGFLIPVVLVIVLAAADRPIQTAAGVGMVLLGLPVYAIFGRGRRAGAPSP
jgi:APA family basic amino acid/polyamine antiporter